MVFEGDTAFDYLFIGGDLRTFNGLWGLIKADGFKVAAVTLSAVPLPAAMPLFAAALGLFGVVGMRRRFTESARASAA